MLCAWHSNLQSVIRPGADQQVAVCSEGRSRPTGCSLCGREGALGMLRAWHSRLQCVLREGAPGALCAWQCALLSGWDHLAGRPSCPFAMEIPQRKGIGMRNEAMQEGSDGLE
eukprot:1144778-Pelagomonas_calceolata.AAC.2